MTKINVVSNFLITVSELSDKLSQNEEIFILDIRDKEDYMINHIDNANHCEWAEAVEYVNEKNPSKTNPLVIVCYNGQSSMQIATILSIYGYQAFSLLDGMEGWLSSNCHVESL